MSQSKAGPVNARSERQQSESVVEPLDALREELRQLRLRKGQPSLRAIAHQTGWSHATVSRALSCESVPRLDVVEAIAQRLDGDVDRLRQLWMACMDTGPKTTDHVPVEQDLPPPPRSDKFPALATGVALCLLLALAATLSFFAPRNPDADKTVTDIALTAFGAAASLAWFACFSRRGDKRSLWLALGMAGWTLWRVRALVADEIGALPHPVAFSVADYLSLLLPLFVLPGLAAALPRQFGQKQVFVWAFVAAIAVSALVSLAAGHFTDLPTSGIFVRALRVAADIAMLALAFLSVKSEPSWESRLISFALAALLLADVLLTVSFLLPQPNLLALEAALCYLAFSLLMMVSVSSTEAFSRREE
ncbi:MAG: helix-turn-helix domain-containing protein [Segniliparus sp.]|uniref:helix-turn-helix domain-containing protein n=1 Tax=Segniliparus sp. TaxID=2804064 RepID=UPI003F2BC4D2